MCVCLVLQALTEYKSELRDDPIISTHLVTLYDNLLEQNLIRVIEPFSIVQVSTPEKERTPGARGGRVLVLCHFIQTAVTVLHVD